MLKKLIQILIFFFIFSSLAQAATLPVKITFDLQNKLHVVKNLNLDSNNENYAVVMSDTKVENNTPVTIALLVRPQNFANNQVTLKFLLVKYSYDGTSTLISEPAIVLLNGHEGILKTSDLLSLKVLSRWS
ncbi:MAG: hypothetical protein ACYCQI_04260 [Gammaproteobacteria bacterium]